MTIMSKSETKRVNSLNSDKTNPDLKPKVSPKVTIEKSVLESLIEKMNKQDKKIEMLIEVADKARLHKFESANKDFSQKTVEISTIGGKIITGWKKVNDEVYQDAFGRWHEKQDIVIYYIDNTKEIITYLDFARRVEKISGTVISKSIDDIGNEIMKVDVNGKQIEIGITFVN